MDSEAPEIPRDAQPGEVGSQEPRDLRDAAGSSDFLDLRKIFWTLVREYRLVVPPIILALACAGIYLLTVPTLYTATARILIDVQQPKVLTGDNLIPGLDVSRYMIGPVIDSQVAILQSESLARRVIRERDFPPYTTRTETASVPSSAPETGMPERDEPGKSKGTAAKTPDGGPVAEARADRSDPIADAIRQETVGSFLSNLKVNRYGLTLILQVQYSDVDPKKAADTANGLARAYLDNQLQSKLKFTRQTALRLSERVASLRKQVVEVEQKIQDYREAHNLNVVAGQTINEREVIETLAQLVTARTDAANKRAEIEEIERLLHESADMMSLSRVLESATIVQLRQQEAQIMRKLATVVSQFGKQDAQVARTDSELSDLRREIDKEIKRLIQNSRNDSAVAEKKVKVVGQKLTELLRSLARLNRSNIEVSELERRSKAANDLYDTLLSRLMQTRAEESFVTPDAQLVEAASVPLSPSSPDKLMALALALIGGVGFGVTLALLKDHMSSPIRGADDASRIFDGGCVASVPFLKMDETAILQNVVYDMSSEYAQSMFTLKRWLLQVNDQLGRGIVVAVVSPNRGEGKTTIAANLGHYAAMSQCKTLLVDCDLRDADLTARYSPHHEATLFDVLEGRAQLDEVVVRDEVSGLAFCPGPHESAVAQPMELLASSQIAETLADAAKSFDLTILDTTALLPFVDARALIHLVDVVLVVIEPWRTATPDALEVIKLVPSLANKRRGIALNKVAPPPGILSVLPGAWAQKIDAWQREGIVRSRLLARTLARHRRGDG